jgi:hypothetical protein
MYNRLVFRTRKSGVKNNLKKAFGWFGKGKKVSIFAAAKNERVH